MLKGIQPFPIHGRQIEREKRAGPSGCSTSVKGRQEVNIGEPTPRAGSSAVPSSHVPWSEDLMGGCQMFDVCSSEVKRFSPSWNFLGNPQNKRLRGGERLVEV